MQPTPREVLAARAVARGDPLAALNAVAGDAGPHARAVRGIALAQLEELDAAQRELRAASDGLREAPLYRARALAALAEVAAARRELGSALEGLTEAAAELERVGDTRNAAWVRLVRARILLLTGATREAAEELASALRSDSDDPVLAGARALVRVEASARSLEGDDAIGGLDAALGELTREEHPLLFAELEAHRTALAAPLARLSLGDRTVLRTLPELARDVSGTGRLPFEADEHSGARRWLVVDAIAKRALFCGEDAVDLGTREVPFALLRELARAWPAAVPTGALIESVFEGPPADESHRDRCRVEIGRLRGLLPGGASIEAPGNAWRLATGGGEPVVRIELVEPTTPLDALLADGQAWAARDLALAIGASRRSVQRALAELAAAGRVEPLGRARSQRWAARLPEQAPRGIASQMFLVSLLDPRDSPCVPPPKGDST